MSSEKTIIKIFLSDHWKLLIHIDNIIIIVLFFFPNNYNGILGSNRVVVNKFKSSVWP